MLTKIEITPANSDATEALSNVDPIVLKQLAEKIITDMGMKPTDVRVRIIRYEVALDSIGTDEASYLSDERRISSYMVPLEKLGLNVRTYNGLRRAGLESVGEILTKLDMGVKGVEDLLVIHSFGKASFRHLIERLKATGYLPPEYQPQSALHGPI